MTLHKPNRWVLHDYLQVNGGAERLVITLTQGLPGFALGVSGIYRGFAGSGDLMGVEPRLIAGPYGLLPRIPRALFAFGNLQHIQHAECVVYSGIYAPLAVNRQRSGRRIMYCHTPPRFAFDLEQRYLDKTSVALRPLLQVAIARYRQTYLKSVHAMDQVVTNSKHVRQRFLDKTGIDSVVVYPPTNLARFRWLGQGDYYLSLGRLEPNKRVERIVEAFMGTDKQLVVTSGGSQYQTLKRIARGAPNIRFTGWQTEAELRSLIGNSIACIYIPKDEDFGMSVVEAMAAGKPVIGVDEGGIRETILHGTTGWLLPPDPTPGDVASAVAFCSSGVAAQMRKPCEARASEFSQATFLSAMRELVA